jgi:hypothetical protein
VTDGQLYGHLLLKLLQQQAILLLNNKLIEKHISKQL